MAGRTQRPTEALRIERERPLTLRQAEILAFIEEHFAENQRMPTRREIGIRFNIRSTNAVTDHLVALDTKGYIAMDWRVSRGIRLLRGVPRGTTEQAVISTAESPPPEDGTSVESNDNSGGAR